MIKHIQVTLITLYNLAEKMQKAARSRFGKSGILLA